MKETHPILESPQRRVLASILALVVVTIQTMFLATYAGAEWILALTDGVLSIGLLVGLAYLAWFVLGFVSMIQTRVIVSILPLTFWLLGCFAIQEWTEWLFDATYTLFILTLPFRVVFGILIWIAVMLWYRLQSLQIACSEAEESEEVKQELEQKAEPVGEAIDRITIKDGSKIHLIKTDELIYIQACGDYVTLITPEGQFVKELTMKYLEAHLCSSLFVRVHRSTIVNVAQISRVELFGKENYRLLLKNGERLRVSLSGYRLLKEKLEL